MLYALTFFYFHPVHPLTLPDAATCQVYGLVSNRNIEETRGNADPLFYLTTKSPPWAWIAKGPIACKKDVLLKVQQLTANPSIYGRVFPTLSKFSPTYQAHRPDGDHDCVGGG
jgi:hypothetical protein